MIEAIDAFAPVNSSKTLMNLAKPVNLHEGLARLVDLLAVGRSAANAGLPLAIAWNDV
jgi:hypothetical protein